MLADLRTIMTPLDGSRLSEEALRVSLMLARATGAVVHPTHVFVPVRARSTLTGLGASDARTERELEQAAREYLNDVTTRTAAEPGAPVSIEPEFARAQAVSSPFGETAAVVAALRRVAARVRPDVIVMSTHGRGGFSRAWLGSVADALVRQMETPLLLVRSPAEAGPAARPIRNVLLPLDGSERGEHVIPLATSIARALEARVTLFQVLVPQRGIARPAPVTRIDQEDLDRRRTVAERYMAELCDRIATSVQMVDTRIVVDENPARAILQWIAEHDIDLVSMTTRALGGARRLMLGSVADKVVRGSPVPVLIVRPETESRPAAERA